MSILVKIQQSTRSDNGGRSLCTTCTQAVNVKGAAESKEICFCNAVDNWITFNVAQCSKYYNRNLPNLQMMFDTAWILESDKKKQTVGFIDNKTWRERNPYKGVVPGEYD
jgi:hypothetical protein